MRRGLCWAVLLAVMGCGSAEEPDLKPHGLFRGRAMADLTTEERTAYCDWATETRGGPGYVEDCDGFTYVVESMDDCELTTVQYGECGLNVGQVDDCTDDIAADLCGWSASEGTPCYPLVTCLASS